jgi:hypothetical protein
LISFSTAVRWLLTIPTASPPSLKTKNWIVYRQIALSRGGAGMAKHPKRKERGASNGAFADSAAYSVLSSEAKSMLEALRAITKSTGHDKNDPILIEGEPARFVEVRLSEKWRKLGAASSENVKRARNIVDLAEAAFEADRATKQ